LPISLDASTAHPDAPLLWQQAPAQPMQKEAIALTSFVYRQ
jgi:hypothetical protein